MQKLKYCALLEDAQTAASAGNWSLLSQSLQPLLLGEEASKPEVSLFSEPETATLLLNLALQVLEFGSFHDRWEIAKILPRFGSNAAPVAVRATLIDALIQGLTDEDADPEAQWFAIRILGDFDHPDVVTALIDVLKTSDNEELSGIAVSALAKMGRSAISVLESLLFEDSTRLFAVQALGQIRHSEIVPLLLRVVNDRDPQVREIAIEALSSFHSPQITAGLVAALKDPAVPVRRAAVTGLGFRHAEDAENFDLVAQLRPLLFDLNLEVCRSSAIALGRLGTAEATAALQTVLQSPHTPESLAIEIVRALGWNNASETLDALQTAFTESILPDSVRVEILTVLGRVEAPELKPKATEALIKALNSQASESPMARQAIALSLGQLGQSAALMPLISLLADPDSSVRLHVISALKTLNPEAARQRLAHLAQTEPAESTLGQGIAIALQEWNP